jgi:hypothetical protein
MKAFTGNAHVAKFLERHPRIAFSDDLCESAGVIFEKAERQREVGVGRDDWAEFGLLELMDNNPLICADKMSIPTLAASLSLIVLGPILLSGLVMESPSFVTNLTTDEDEIATALRTTGWDEGVTVRTEPEVAPEIAMATGIAVIQNVSDPEEIAELYEERFGTSALIRQATEGDWIQALVATKPLAIYRISLATDQPTSLLSVRVIWDRSGVFHAAQIVNAMNVMLGFEDTLGITV